jgi:transcriptional regulator with XRE-family HTH domain
VTPHCRARCAPFPAASIAARAKSGTHDVNPVVLMAEKVENFSDTGKPYRSDLLGSASSGAARISRPMTPALHKRQVGENLRMAREALGLSQAALASRFGLGDDSKVSNWERGLNYPDPYFIWRLWSEEGITADWIFLRQPQRVPAELVGSLREAAKALEAGDRGEDAPQELRKLGRPPKASSSLPPAK